MSRFMWLGIACILIWNFCDFVFPLPTHTYRLALFLTCRACVCICFWDWEKHFRGTSFTNAAPIIERSVMSKNVATATKICATCWFLFSSVTTPHCRPTPPSPLLKVRWTSLYNSPLYPHPQVAWILAHHRLFLHPKSSRVFRPESTLDSLYHHEASRILLRKNTRLSRFMCSIETIEDGFGLANAFPCSFSSDPPRGDCTCKRLSTTEWSAHMYACHACSSFAEEWYCRLRQMLRVERHQHKERIYFAIPPFFIRDLAASHDRAALDVFTRFNRPFCRSNRTLLFFVSILAAFFQSYKLLRHLHTDLCVLSQPEIAPVLLGLLFRLKPQSLLLPVRKTKHRRYILHTLLAHHHGLLCKLLDPRRTCYAMDRLVCFLCAEYRPDVLEGVLTRCCRAQSWTMCFAGEDVSTYNNAAADTNNTLSQGQGQTILVQCLLRQCSSYAIAGILNHLRGLTTTRSTELLRAMFSASTVMPHPKMNISTPLPLLEYLLYSNSKHLPMFFWKDDEDLTFQCSALTPFRLFWLVFGYVWETMDVPYQWIAQHVNTTPDANLPSFASRQEQHFRQSIQLRRQQRRRQPQTQHRCEKPRQQQEEEGSDKWTSGLFARISQSHQYWFRTLPLLPALVTVLGKYDFTTTFVTFSRSFFPLTVCRLFLLDVAHNGDFSDIFVQHLAAAVPPLTTRPGNGGCGGSGDYSDNEEKQEEEEEDEEEEEEEKEEENNEENRRRQSGGAGPRAEKWIRERQTVLIESLLCKRPLPSFSLFLAYARVLGETFLPQLFRRAIQTNSTAILDILLQAEYDQPPLSSRLHIEKAEIEIARAHLAYAITPHLLEQFVSDLDNMLRLYSFLDEHCSTLRQSGQHDDEFERVYSACTFAARMLSHHLDTSSSEEENDEDEDGDDDDDDDDVDEDENGDLYDDSVTSPLSLMDEDTEQAVLDTHQIPFADLIRVSQEFVDNLPRERYTTRSITNAPRFTLKTSTLVYHHIWQETMTIRAAMESATIQNPLYLFVVPSPSRSAAATLYTLYSKEDLLACIHPMSIVYEAKMRMPMLSDFYPIYPDRVYLRLSLSNGQTMYLPFCQFAFLFEPETTTTFRCFTLCKLSSAHTSCLVSYRVKHKLGDHHLESATRAQEDGLNIPLYLLRETSIVVFD